MMVLARRLGSKFYLIWIWTQEVSTKSWPCSTPKHHHNSDVAMPLIWELQPSQHFLKAIFDCQREKWNKEDESCVEFFLFLLRLDSETQGTQFFVLSPQDYWEYFNIMFFSESFSPRSLTLSLSLSHTFSQSHSLSLSLSLTLSLLQGPNHLGISIPVSRSIEEQTHFFLFLVRSCSNIHRSKKRQKRENTSLSLFLF